MADYSSGTEVRVERLGPSDIVVERLLEGVRQHPCVFDTKRMDYRDSQRKRNAWEIIRQQCGPATGQLPENRVNKRKKSDTFEQDLLKHLDKRMSENEAFALSVGLTLDRLSKPTAAECKAKMMLLLSEYDL
ncbi:uncharacterized protein LOC135384447 [Ornithodoros turicata]|uniref:uncharacterized protein LOC135384447 n=1 Tax=Ornithodoros turicata TaxID=34597 RepID=UPI00313A2587